MPKRNLWQVLCPLLLAALVLLAPMTRPARADSEIKDQIRNQFVAFDADYDQDRRNAVDQLRALGAEVIRSETAGTKNVCAHQILFEVEALLTTSAHFDAINARLADLRRALRNPSQDRADASGMWGACYTQWYLKLYATFDYLNSHAGTDPAPRPLPAFLAPFDTPAKLAARLDALSVSDIRTTGIDNAREFNETLATILQMIVRRAPENYSVDPALRQALIDRLSAYRDPATGFWGEHYRLGSRMVVDDDLSITFHIVSYLKGRVSNLPLLLDKTLKLKDTDFPEGWLWHGGYWNHNNMDVVTIFRYAWPVSSVSQRAAVAAEIQKMLDWCLTQSLQPDGSFKFNIADGSVEDSEYYGTSFLSRVGFFDPAKRFWTDKPFAQAPDVRKRILEFVRTHASSGPTGDDYRSTLEALGG